MQAVVGGGQVSQQRHEVAASRVDRTSAHVGLVSGDLDVAVIAQRHAEVDERNGVLEVKVCEQLVDVVDVDARHRHVELVAIKAARSVVVVALS